MDPVIIQGKGSSAIMLVPTMQVLLKATPVPPLPKSQLAKTLPYQVEDALINAVEDNHFAFYLTDSSHAVLSICARKVMEDWLSHLQSAGLAAERILPDVLALPLHTEGWSMAIDDEFAWVRLSRDLGFQVPLTELPLWLKAAVQQHAAPVHLYCWAKEAPASQSWPAPLQTIPLHHLPLPAGGIAELLTTHISTAPTEANLLQGQFSPKTRLSFQDRRFALAALGVLFAILWQMGDLEVKRLTLQQENDALDVAIETTFKSFFPNEKRVVNWQQQWRNQLQKLQQDARKSDFLPLLAQVGESLKAVPTVSISNVQFFPNKQQLEIELRAPKLEVLDQIKQSLAAKAIQLDIRSANTTADGVDATITVRATS